MIEYSEFSLSNGLDVIVHEDRTVEVATLNLLYKVGSKDESEDKTGFAHLFEHLMFGGSQNVPEYDQELQLAGGDNNAFTSPDITNYYLTVPAANIETGFWLESDRMMGLSFDPKVLEVQRNVVIEEFRQRYINQPYGEAWLKLRPLAFKKHPYRWPTIGKNIEHIEKATMDDVRDFFYRFYVPNNAILVVAGNVDLEEIKSMAEKWFGPIKPGKDIERNGEVEPPQIEKRTLAYEADVPLESLYKVYHMPSRKSNGYHSADLLSDILGRGNSSRLYQELVKKNKLFNDIGAYVTGSVDPGLLVINGKLNDGVGAEEGEKYVDAVIARILKKGVEKDELDKVKNQVESTLLFNEVETLNKAMSLAFAKFLGDADLVNKEIELVNEVTTADILESANNILKEENCSTLYYKSKGK